MASPVPPGLCASCQHAETIVSGRGSKFVRCGLFKQDPRYPKYPRLPVVSCEGWTPQPPSTDREERTFQK